MVHVQKLQVMLKGKDSTVEHQEAAFAMSIPFIHNQKAPENPEPIHNDTYKLGLLYNNSFYLPF
ncbi:hypothetical protein DRF67_03495 [Chryseobacterium pennipullorum]|uniref:Uncharacterized protein n=1 Tax=Chryseobacterium pennipullorum TaxID=2258963 RepID=A0A3D9B883_9FLAO|nr:hypothetical protein DRF67_03495 [Chryseobacterium pennipullorum]